MEGWWLYLVWMVLGCLLTLVAQILFLVWYIKTAPQGSPIPPPPEHQEFHLPKELGGSSPLESGDCAAALSLSLQFLWQELRHAPPPLAWLHRNIQHEMTDLLTKSTTGKLFESINIRSMSLGTVCPSIRWAGVQLAETGGGGRLRHLQLLLDVHYEGGFCLGVDAGMLLGKTPSLQLEVEHLSGRACLSFSRVPYTHWSIAFVSPPRLELRCRPLKGRLAALLQAHARRALHRRHTLPNYTIRYKPFFSKVDPAVLDLPNDDPSIKLQGNLEINLVEVTRLFTHIWTESKPNKHLVYCTTSIDSTPWISYRQDDEYSIFILDIVINKERTQQLGTVFKQVNIEENKHVRSYVTIETIVPLSAAYRADLRKGDILVAVDSKTVTNMNQVAKVVKAVHRPCFTMRIERRIKRFQSEDSKMTFKDPSKDSLSVGEGSDEQAGSRRGKSNSFSFRKMSEVLESARNVGQEGRALLRAAHSNSNIQEADSKSLLSEQGFESLDPSNQFNQTARIPSKTEAESCAIPAKASNSLSNTISFSKHSDSIQMSFGGFGLRKRRCSVENRTSSDSSTSSTPTASNPGTPSKRAERPSRESLITTKPIIEDHASIKEVKQKDSDNVSNVAGTESDNLSIGEEAKECGEQVGNPKISVVNTDKSKIQNENAEYFDLLKSHVSGALPLSELLEYNEKISFKLNRNHRYLNVNVWGKMVDDEGVVGSEDVLLAYLNIPLRAVLKECKSSRIGQHLRRFTLLPPDVNLTVGKYDPLSAHKGFEPCLCYGDALLSFQWSAPRTPGQQAGSLSKEPSIDGKSMLDSELDLSMELDSLDGTTGLEDTDGGKRKMGADGGPLKQHDFLRTHFHRSTQCDFCGKKIWLKDAMQCRECAMCCHKKCVLKCQSSVPCQPPSIMDYASSSPTQESSMTLLSQTPEFLMTQHLDGDNLNTSSRGAITPAASQESLLKDEGGLGRATLAGILGGLRRVGSAHSLAPPSAPPPPARSLPPSPHHTPRQSPDEDAPWSALEVMAEGGAGAEELLRPLLAARLPPDALLGRARDLGPRLMASLPHTQRADRLATLITEVRVALDEESLRLSGLQQQQHSKSSGSRQLGEQLELAEQRSHALTALLLHCCAAMQSHASTQHS